MDESECDHESWECSTAGAYAWHKCANGCGLNWQGGSREGDENCTVCQETGRIPMIPGNGQFVTKDSGKREEYDSGMVRDTQDGKPRYDLLVPDGVPFRAQFLTRVAELLARGAEKYTDRNWERASGPEELGRFKSSAYRHLMQWLTDEQDEDHAAAVVFNLLAYETIKWKLDHAEDSSS
jgi:hypothetical protein